MMKTEKKVVDELKKWIFKDTRTLKLMDEFEGVGSNIKYRRLVLENRIWANGAWCHLVIERASNCDYEGNITFTDFKKGCTWTLNKYVVDQIKKVKIEDYVGNNKILYFDKPYRLRAQSSLDRTGYGDRWDWSDRDNPIQYIGTKYGDTTDYIFAGVYIE